MSKYKIVNRGLLRLVITTIVMTFILGCSEFRNLNSTAMTYNGPSQDLGEGRAYAFTALNDSGEPLGYPRFQGEGCSETKGNPENQRE